MNASEAPDTLEETSAKTFFVLKERQMVGPFSLKDLQAQSDRGALKPSDLVQREDRPIWRPLSVVLSEELSALASSYASVHGPVPGELPGWKQMGQWAWQRICRDVENPSLKTTLGFLGVAAAALVLSWIPFVFWLPWFAAALIAGAGLLRGGRPTRSLFLLVALIAIPHLLFSGKSRLLTHRATFEVPPVTADPGATPR
jgi:hypothetical protein